jgi:hypothetical protein
MRPTTPRPHEGAAGAFVFRRCRWPSTPVPGGDAALEILGTDPDFGSAGELKVSAPKMSAKIPVGGGGAALSR